MEREGVFLEEIAKSLGRYRSSSNQLAAKARKLPVPPKNGLKGRRENTKLTYNYS
jgi:hypothetical protein